MYLSIKHHDQFRTLLMGFEIPFRAYIADIIVKKYNNAQAFETAMINKYNLLSSSSPAFLTSVLREAIRKRSLIGTYQRFQTASNSTNEIITTDVEIPMVGALNLVTFALTEDFMDLYAHIKICRNDLFLHFYLISHKLEHYSNFILTNPPRSFTLK